MATTEILPICLLSPGCPGITPCAILLLSASEEDTMRNKDPTEVRPSGPYRRQRRPLRIYSGAFDTYLWLARGYAVRLLPTSWSGGPCDEDLSTSRHCMASGDTLSSYPSVVAFPSYWASITLRCYLSLTFTAAHLLKAWNSTFPKLMDRSWHFPVPVKAGNAGGVTVGV